MKTSIFSLPNGTMTFHEAVDYVKQLGVDAIEPYNRSEFQTPSVENAKKLRDYAAEQGVGISCFSMMGNLALKDQKAEIERLKGFIDTAAAMGSPYFHHTLIPGLTFGGDGRSFKEYLNYVVPAARELYDYAEQQGVKCCYEDQGFVFNGVHRFDDLLGEMERPVGVVADLGNILFVGDTPEAFVARFASRICHVHVKDYLSKDARWSNPGQGWYVTRDGGFLRGTIVGHGVVCFERVFTILNDAGYDGYFSLECDCMEEIFKAQKLSIENMRRFYRMAQVSGQKAIDVSLN